MEKILNPEEVSQAVKREEIGPNSEPALDLLLCDLFALFCVCLGQFTLGYIFASPNATLYRLL